MNTINDNNTIVIDLNLPLGSEACDLYMKRMMIVCDVAEKLPDYYSVVVIDHGIVVRTIESRRKRQEDILKSMEYFKKFFWEKLKAKEKETFEK